MSKRLQAFRKKHKSDNFQDSKYGIIQGWLSTGDYALNRLLTGDIYRGIPYGRITQFAGESQTGKSLVGASVIISALKEGFDLVMVFDSEGGMTRGFIENSDVDMTKIELCPVMSIEDCNIQMLDAFEMVREEQAENPDFKALFVVDSLGALVPQKLRDDAIIKGKMASDMGLGAKLKNAFIKAITGPSVVTHTPVFIVNHIYDDPAAMFASKIKNVSGGKGAQYMPHITVQCAKTNDKNESKTKQKTDEQSFKGTILKFFTAKNRVCKSFYDAQLYLEYDKGRFQKWFGLFKPAIEMGFIIQSGAWYTVPSWEEPEKKFRGSQILSNDDIWMTFLDDFNKKSLEKYAYSSPEVIDEESMDQYVEDLMKEDEVESEG